MNKVALITGGALRIGACITKTLHQAGYCVAIHYRQSQSQAQALAEELNHQRPNSAVCIQADLNNSSSLPVMVTQASTAWGRLDLLINNASSFYPTAIGQCTDQDWDALMNSNVKGPFFISQAATHALKQSQGNIINIVDIHSERPLKNHSIYCMAKAALAMMTKSLAKELGPDIRVNGISPGAILWPENEGFGETEKNEILDRISLNRAGEASDIANTVLFLADNAPYISGQILAVDGGRTLNN